MAAQPVRADPAATIANGDNGGLFVIWPVTMATREQTEPKRHRPSHARQSHLVREISVPAGEEGGGLGKLSEDGRNSMPERSCQVLCSPSY